MAMKISKRGVPTSGHKKPTNLYAVIFAVLIFFMLLVFFVLMASKQPAPVQDAQIDAPPFPGISLPRNTIINSLAEGSPLSIVTK